MNTKLSFALLMIIIATIVTACVPVIVDRPEPVVPVALPANPETPAVLPVTGGSDSTTVREAQAPRLWSGEVFLSDNDMPDVNISTNHDQQSACMSEGDLPRRYGGCVE